ncbi:CC_3452 family protein [Sphingomonas sp.]|uniref:CC_3452 family protein n=1 Tax=Sphingomonas sp. TaxID=28214 RepID=UPI002C3087CE|nr:hypothetical protein [Sphingomonas sp.]HWK36542.1 hypothetical protein [Sphingomonas sp.]
MIRIVSTAAAAAASLMLFAAVPATAQGNAYYSATAASGQLKKASLVTRNTIWKCSDTVCTAGKAPDRDTTVCAMVAQRIGQLSAFTANGTAFTGEALEKCNGSAK